MKKEGKLFLQSLVSEADWQEISATLTEEDLQWKGKDGKPTVLNVSSLKGAKTVFTSEKHSFSVQDTAQKYVFHGSSPQDRNDWVAAINCNIASKAKQDDVKASAAPSPAVPVVPISKAKAPDSVLDLHSGEYGKDANELNNLLGLPSPRALDASTIKLSHSNLVNNRDFADTVFQFGHHDQLFAHEAVLNVRAPELMGSMSSFAKISKKKGIIHVEIKEDKDKFLNCDSLYQVLFFVYSGEVGFEGETNFNKMLSIVILAKRFAISELEWRANVVLRKTITLANLHSCLKAAHEAGNIASDQRNFCLEEARKNYAIFVGKKEGAKIIGLDLFQSVMQELSSATETSFRTSHDPSAVPTSTLVDDYKRLYQQTVTDKGGDLVVELRGKAKLTCHRAILGAQSKNLHEVLSTAKTPRGSRKPTLGKPLPISLPDISAGAFKFYLRYIYYGDSRFPALPAMELVGFAKQFELPALRYVCEDKITKSIAINTVVDILCLSYSKEMLDRNRLAMELRLSCLAFLHKCRHSGDDLGRIDFSKLRKMPANVGCDVLDVLKRAKNDIPQAVPAKD